MSIKYPKIQSLFKREGQLYTPEQIRNLTPEQKANRGRFTNEYSLPEFENITNWIATEKIDGTNVRIICKRNSETKKWDISIAGRTDKSQIHPQLFKSLTDHFTHDLLERTFSSSNEVILFGEGCGKDIQNGIYYSNFQRFVLFDVFIDNTWWLDYATVVIVSVNLDIFCVLLLGELFTKEQLIDFVKSKPHSRFAEEVHEMEGIVATAYPMMLRRDGTPIRFKLKCKDFRYKEK